MDTRHSHSYTRFLISTLFDSNRNHYQSPFSSSFRFLGFRSFSAFIKASYSCKTGYGLRALRQQWLVLSQKSNLFGFLYCFFFFFLYVYSWVWVFQWIYLLIRVLSFVFAGFLFFSYWNIYQLIILLEGISGSPSVFVISGCNWQWVSLRTLNFIYLFFIRNWFGMFRVLLVLKFQDFLFVINLKQYLV